MLLDPATDRDTRRQLLRARRALTFHGGGSPDQELGIETMAVLFTDLVGSTAMYASVGDSSAFGVVAKHFALMTRIVESAHGAIVKTVGDGIMAAFISPAACLEAALAMDEAVRGLGPNGANLRVRAGFALGPCIRMRSVGSSDYFGTTVNVAARLQAKAGAGEIMMPHSVVTRLDVRAVLRSSGRRTRSAMLGVRGYATAMDVVRVLGAGQSWIPF